MKKSAEVTTPPHEYRLHESTSITGVRAYSAYGHSNSESAAILLAFNGQALEPLIQGYLLGNGVRLYCCALMRFTTPDSFSPFGKGGLNSYGYCSGDPINHVDPSGHSYAKVSAYRRDQNLRSGARRLPRHVAVESIDDPTLLATTSRVEPRSSTRRVKTKTPALSAEQPWDGGAVKKHWDAFSETLGIKEMTSEKRAKVVYELVQHQVIKELGSDGVDIKQKMALSMLWQLGYGANVTKAWGERIAADILARNNEAVRAFVGT